MLGALKNVVALAAGFCDGMTGVGVSTKAAVIRQGVVEMALFCRLYAADTFQLDTMLRSCGIAG